MYLAVSTTSLVALEVDTNEGTTNNVAHVHAAIALAIKLIRNTGDCQICGPATSTGRQRFENDLCSKREWRSLLGFCMKTCLTWLSKNVAVIASRHAAPKLTNKGK